MIVAGIDVGSLTGKTVVLRAAQQFGMDEILASSIVPTTVKPERTAMNAFNQALEKAHVNNTEIDYSVGTGYGRVKIPFANKNVSEISCHGRGAHYLLPNVHTIIDIGGQDSKVICVNEEGKLIDFTMNDKCAAGTGRFIEVMARTLETTLDNMGPLALKSQHPKMITAQCSVFAETEVVSLIADGVPVEDIVAGLTDSIASRVVSLVNRIGLKPELTITGGVAKNIGVVKSIEAKLNLQIKPIPIDPQIIGALGAALFAKEALIKKQAEEKGHKLKKWDF
ncbi:MAG: acyl-CoA dehydratase activase [Candidatus Helarchaeota archaeon]|nr:acyl-CoA dehydratase activase [Candidatus Helarchaeota archaeon]